MQKEDINWAIFKLDPDFELLRKYVNIGANDKEFKSIITNYKKQGSLIHVPFMDASQENSFANELTLIINKHPLEGHGTNLSYLILTLLKFSYTKWTEYRVPAIGNLQTIDEFKDLVNHLLKFKSNRFKITLEATNHEQLKNVKRTKKKTSSIDVSDHKITDWIINLLLNSIMNQQYPLNIAPQLLGSSLVCDIVTKREFLKIREDRYYEQQSIDTIRTDAITEVCVPLINYLQIETSLKKGGAKHWSSEQLGFLIEVLILINYYESKLPNFKLGISEPSVADKKYLDSTLHNKLKQGKILIFNTIALKD